MFIPFLASSLGLPRLAGATTFLRRFRMIIDGYEIRFEKDGTVIYKDGEVKAMYFGITDSKIVLRQFVDAIRNAEDERS